MKAIFLADAHLKNVKDEGYCDLMEFIHLMPVIDRLFIAGDFFDFWFCRDRRVYPQFTPIIDELVNLQQRGTEIVIFEGNHDFHLESYFAEILGMTVYNEWAGIDLDDRKILISHGDTIDKTNRKYLLLRKIFRSRLFYRIQKMVPLVVLWKIARFCSVTSKELTMKSESKIVQKMEVFSLEKFREGVDAVIVGHCHKPVLKEYVLDGRKRTFATLGDWIKHHSYLYYEDGNFTLRNYRPINRTSNSE